jgi:hypothetical protein
MCGEASVSRGLVGVFAALVLIAGIARSEDLRCTIRPPKTAAKKDLAGMARIPEADAKRAALAALAAAQKTTVEESELEVEHGCLVYSFDIRVAGEKGIREVLVDAGDGKVLKTEHETEAAEAREKKRDSP